MNCAPLVNRLKRELHWTKLVFRDKDWRSLAFTPWLPYDWWQVVYIAARWIVFLYYFAYLIVIFVPPSAYTLLYLTNWSFIVLTLYLLVAAVSCTLSSVRWACKHRRRQRSGQYDVSHAEGGDRSDGSDAPPSQQQQTTDGDITTGYRGVCGVVSFHGDQLSLLQKVQWVLFTIAICAQLSVAILFWTLLAPTSSPEVLSSFGNLNTHLTGAVVCSIDLLVNGITISIYHLYLCVLFGSSYFLFAVLYYYGGGTDAQGSTSIYPPLDFENNLEYALGLSFISNFVFLPGLYVGVYLVCCVRRWVVSRVRNCFSGRGGTTHSRERGDVRLLGTDGTAGNVRYSTLKTDKQSTSV